MELKVLQAKPAPAAAAQTLPALLSDRLSSRQKAHEQQPKSWVPTLPSLVPNEDELEMRELARFESALDAARAEAEM